MPTKTNASGVANWPIVWVDWEMNLGTGIDRRTTIKPIRKPISGGESSILSPRTEKILGSSVMPRRAPSNWMLKMPTVQMKTQLAKK